MKLIEKIKKRLYEWCKPEIEPVKFEVTHTNLQHYATCKFVNKYEQEDSFIPKEIYEREILKFLMMNLEPAIRKNIVIEEDISGRITYRVDIWLKN